MRQITIVSAVAVGCLIFCHGNAVASSSFFTASSTSKPSSKVPSKSLSKSSLKSSSKTQQSSTTNERKNITWKTLVATDPATLSSSLRTHLKNSTSSVTATLPPSIKALLSDHVFLIKTIDMADRYATWISGTKGIIKKCMNPLTASIPLHVAGCSIKSITYTIRTLFFINYVLDYGHFIYTGDPGPIFDLTQGLVRAPFTESKKEKRVKFVEKYCEKHKCSFAIELDGVFNISITVDKKKTVGDLMGKGYREVYSLARVDM